MVSQFADYNLCEEELNNFEREKRFFVLMENRNVVLTFLPLEKS